MSFHYSGMSLSNAILQKKFFGNIYFIAFFLHWQYKSDLKIIWGLFQGSEIALQIFMHTGRKRVLLTRVGQP